MRDSKTEQRAQKAPSGEGGAEGGGKEQAGLAVSRLQPSCLGATSLALSAPGLCRNCSLYLQHPVPPFHSYSTFRT